MLPLSRLINLIYFAMIQNMKVEDRKKLDDALVRVGNPTAAWTSPVDVPTPKRRAPSWWRGDQAAAQSSIAAARSMGFTVMEQT